MSAPLKSDGGEAQTGTVLDVILSEFDKLGYKIVYGLVNAVDYIALVCKSCKGDEWLAYVYR